MPPSHIYIYSYHSQGVTIRVFLPTHRFCLSRRERHTGLLVDQGRGILVINGVAMKTEGNSWIGILGSQNLDRIGSLPMYGVKTEPHPVS